MEQLRAAALAGIDHRVVDRLVHCHRTHRDCPVGQGLGHGDEVRLHIKALRCKGLAGAAKTGDDFIEHQQDPVFVTDIAQAFQVTRRRHIHADGAGNRLHKTGGNAVAAVHGDDSLQIAGQIGALLRFAQLIALVFLPGVTHMADVGQAAGGEGLAVAHHPRQGHAAKIDPMIGPLPGHKSGALGFTAGTVIGQGNLHRAVHRLGAGVGEKQLVQPLGQQFAQTLGQLEGQRRGALEVRGEIQGQQLLAHRFGDLGTAMPGGAAEQPGAAIEQLAAFGIPVAHALGADEQLRCALELAVVGERHPLVVQIRRHACHS